VDINEGGGEEKNIFFIFYLQLVSREKRGWRTFYFFLMILWSYMGFFSRVL